MLVFAERGKPENPEKNLSEQGRVINKNQQTQPTYDTEGEGRGESRSTRRKTSRSREKNQQQTQPT